MELRNTLRDQLSRPPLVIDNALKYGREGGTIRLDLVQLPGAYRLEVWNEGDGVSSDKLARLFQKFVRFGGDEVLARRGTGLGLFITKEIIGKHGGDIQAESAEGQWMRFTVTLPIAGPASAFQAAAPVAP
ncbi:MAG: sensor histidine kinase [Acidobacteriota bacterium]